MERSPAAKAAAARPAGGADAAPQRDLGVAGVVELDPLAIAAALPAADLGHHEVAGREHVALARHRVADAAPQQRDADEADAQVRCATDARGDQNDEDPWVIILDVKRGERAIAGLLQIHRDAAGAAAIA